MSFADWKQEWTKKKELELEQVAENMDAQGQQENDDCQEEGLQDHPEYLACNPGK